MLNLYEEITLLSLDPANHTFPSSVPEAYYNITAAILVELSIHRRIRCNTDHIVSVIDTTSTGDALLDDALRLISRSRRPRTVKLWIIQLTRLKRLLDRVIQQLKEKGTVMVREQTFLFFRFRRYHHVNPAVIESLKFKVQNVNDADRNERIACVIALVVTGEKAFPHLFTAEEWADVKQRFSGFIASHPLPTAVREVLSYSGGDELPLLLMLAGSIVF